MKTFAVTVENIFDVSVHFKHDFHFDTNASKSFTEIELDIFREIDDRTFHALKFIESINVFVALYFIFILYK